MANVLSHNLKSVTSYRGGETDSNNIYEYHLSDGKSYEQNFVCENGKDVDAIALAYIPKIEVRLLESELIAAFEIATKEKMTDFIPVYQTQPEFDLALLTRFMREPDVHIFSNSIPFFQTVASRPGNNNDNARAAYLGIPRTGAEINYNDIQKRYNDAIGAETYVTNVKGQVW